MQGNNQDTPIGNQVIYFLIKIFIYKIYIKNQPTAYGLEIDCELYNEAMNRILLGLTVDPHTLREMLSVILLKHEKSNLLAAPGSFGASWAQRFFKRHKLSSRVATTKMREEAPANFLEKESTYKKVAAVYVAKHNVPKSLVVGIDETNALLVNRATKQRAQLGAKRVRVIGMGQEKSQITVTLGANEETGELLPTQYIFGGKTTRCHPKDPPTREGDYFDHTESHWQTPGTFMKYLDEVVMPYKEATITRLGLPVDQKMILKLDLHYSHKDKEVLALMKQMNILPLFVPAGCTDIMQECDTVINTVIKMQKIVETSDKTMKLLGDINEWLKEIGNKACENTENTNISQLLADVHAKLESDVCRLRAW